MSVARRNGNPGKADLLFSRIVRSRGRCEYPGCVREATDTAHLIGRRYSATRCLEDNAAAMCRTHHQLIDQFWDEKHKVVEALIGVQRYAELRELANAGPQQSSANFWTGEVERLTERCRELGIDTRRKIPA